MNSTLSNYVWNATQKNNSFWKYYIDPNLPRKLSRAVQFQAKIDWKFEVVIMANWSPATTIKDVFSFVVIKTIMDIVFIKIYRAIKYVFSRNNLHLEFHKKKSSKNELPSKQFFVSLIFWKFGNTHYVFELINIFGANWAHTFIP